MRITLFSTFLTSFISAAALCADASAAPKLWDYNGDSESWARLTPDYGTCAAGIDQSPIDIDTEKTEKKPLPAFTPRYGIVKDAVLENGPVGMRVVVPAGQMLALGNELYELKEIRFHTPSEHSIDMKETPMEIQFMHQGAKGEMLNVAVLVRMDEETKTENIGLTPLWEIFKPGAQPRITNVHFSAADLLPSKRSYFRYSGSLTTPPCTEGVTWLVMREGIYMSPAQFKTMANVVSRNSREPQKRGLRILEESK